MSTSEPVRVISVEAAQAALDAAISAARMRGIKINAAVVDAGGNLAGFLRMPHAPLHSIDIAIDKAYSAVSFGIPTSEWDSILRTGSEGFRSGFVQRDRLVTFGGGLPLFEEGVLIGGIGVSGGSETEDEVCAEAGRQAINAG